MSDHSSMRTAGKTHSSGHTLDLVITGEEDSIVSNVDTFDLCISDHAAISFNLRLKKPPPVTKNISSWSLNKVDTVEFLSDPARLDVVANLPDDLSLFVSAYDAGLSGLLDTHAL